MRKQPTLITPAELSGVKFIEHLGVHFTESGHAYMQTDDQKYFIEIKRSRIGAKGHVICSIKGRTIYLARMIFCLFTLHDGSKYDELPSTGILRYMDNDYSNCSADNLKLDSKRETVKRDTDKLPVWEIRLDYCDGMTFHELAGKYDVSESYVRGLCRGFDGLTREKVENMLHST